LLARPPYGRRVAAIFDLEGLLIDLRPAWAFAVEQAVAAVTGHHVQALPLADEYSWRPWAHVLAVLVPDAAAARRAEALCGKLFTTSALKRIAVPEGLGMALDALRELRVELGVVSRQPHGLALRQLEATGLDRFFAVLAPTPESAAWDPRERVRQCLAYLEVGVADALFVTADPYAARRGEEAEIAVLAVTLEPGARGPRLPAGLARQVAERLAALG